MRRRGKIIFCLFCLVLSIFIITGCTDDTSNNKNVLEEAQNSLMSLKSLSYDMSMDMQFKVMGSQMEMYTEASADCIVDPMSMYMNINIAMEGIDVEAQMYVFQKDGVYEVYSNMPASGEDGWYKQELVDIKEFAQYDVQSSMELYLNSIDDFKKTGAETVDGVSTVKYEGIISEDAISEVLEVSGAMEQFGALGLQEDEIDEVFNDLGELPIKIWLNEENYMPVKYEMDMTELMQQLMNNLLGEENTAAIEVVIDKMQVSLKLYNFDSVDTIELPSEAKDAEYLEQ